MITVLIILIAILEGEDGEIAIGFVETDVLGAGVAATDSVAAADSFGRIR